MESYVLERTGKEGSGSPNMSVLRYEATSLYICFVGMGTKTQVLKAINMHNPMIAQLLFQHYGLIY